MAHYITTVLDWSIIALFGGLVGWFGATLKKQKHERAMILALGKSRLHRDCKRCLKRGFITIEELSTLGTLFEAYKSLGGNGEIANMYARCKDLEIREDE